MRVQGNDILFPQDNRCLPCDYGPSAFDVKHRVVVSTLYELPIGPGRLISAHNRALVALVGGWQLGGIFTHQTGAIATPQDGTDRSGIQGAGGITTDRTPRAQAPIFTAMQRRSMTG